MNQEDLDKTRTTEVNEFRQELTNLLKKHNITLCLTTYYDEPTLSFDTPNTTGNEIKSKYIGNRNGDQYEITPDLI